MSHRTREEIRRMPALSHSTMIGLRARSTRVVHSLQMWQGLDDCPGRLKRGRATRPSCLAALEPPDLARSRRWLGGWVTRKAF
ncbi:hypothetical protein EVAR_33343_1 [Eumeta japonica]|uniref:Uncharacterized protein n=1 Tax=Eumeta variegata TaxID=151549 RepID=A0A4C1YNV6_EUMVA|nr:hypothetical protein EVAR_33343_1 [Eumeta japonica]